MRLATFQSPTGPQAAVVASDETLVPVAGLVAGAPSDMLGLIDAGPGLWDRIRAAASSARGGTPVRTVRLLAPIPRPRRNVLCVGWNYVEHFEEGKSMRAAGAPQDMPKHPAFFSKQPNAVIGHGAEVWYSGHVSPQLDWEVELAAIIGASGRDIPESEALKHVFGYTVGNDVSVRDVQRDWHGGQWFKGKSFDTSCPLGPWIVTADELGDQRDLGRDGLGAGGRDHDGHPARRGRRPQATGVPAGWGRYGGGDRADRGAPQRHRAGAYAGVTPPTSVIARA